VVGSGENQPKNGMRGHWKGGGGRKLLNKPQEGVSEAGERVKPARSIVVQKLSAIGGASQRIA